MSKTTNSFFSECKTVKKKILIIVPHEDDEINVAGGILANYAYGQAEVKVVFTTNGDCFEDAYVRQREASDSLGVLGICKDNIIFLGYPDQLDMRQEKWKSKKGVNRTQSTKLFDDFRYARDGYHSELSHENLVRDIQDVILDFLPDEIYCVDFDSHTDHREASLAFEEAMGRILNKGENYYPTVYKGFAYPTAFKGKRDFGRKGNSTKFVKEEFAACDMQNPYYVWEQRVRFPVVEKVRKPILMQNAIYRALAKHKSQLIICQADRIINQDQIFWQRRTDSLLYKADICVSSGDGAYLNDYILFDNTNMMMGNYEYPKFDKRVWIPDADDMEKSIVAKFKTEVEIQSIVFYMGCNTEAYINKIRISMDNGFVQEFILGTDKVQKLELGRQINVNQLQIEVLEATGEGAGFSELEIFGSKENSVRFIKLTEDDEFCYSTDSMNGKKIYLYNGESSASYSVDEVCEVKKERLGKKEYYIINLLDNPDIFDIVVCEKGDKDCKLKIILICNKLSYGVTYCCYRILRKTRNIAKKMKKRGNV